MVAEGSAVVALRAAKLGAPYAAMLGEMDAMLPSASMATRARRPRRRADEAGPGAWARPGSWRRCPRAGMT